jgi:hypothetical protein
VLEIFAENKPSFATNTKATGQLPMNLILGENIHFFLDIYYMLLNGLYEN